MSTNIPPLLTYRERLAKILELADSLQHELEMLSAAEAMKISGDVYYMKPYFIPQLTALKIDVYYRLKKDLTNPDTGVTLSVDTGSQGTQDKT
jgi:hypothetical protein